MWLLNLRFGWFRGLRAELYRPRPADWQAVAEALSQAETARLQAENDSLRQLLGANLPAAWQFIPAQVVSFKNGVLTITAGSQDGAAAGMPVLALAAGRSGVVVGRISTVQPYLAQVEAVTGAKAKTPAGAAGEIDGSQLVKVRQNASLQPGDLVMTAGGDGWPPDLLIGRVKKVENVPTAIYQSARWEPVIGPEALSQVFILKLTLED